MTEVWAPILEFEDLYQISNLGNVRRIGFLSRGRNLKVQVGKRGYFTVSLWRRQKGSTRTIHRLLAEAFIPNPHNKREVNHKNGIKTDNRLVNLEWTTPQENSAHAKKTKVCRAWHHKRGAYRGPGGNGWQAQINLNGRRKSLGVYATKEEAHEAYRKKYVAHFGFEPWEFNHE